VKVRYDEGVATRIGPEPCADGREAIGKASVGDSIGQPLSRDRNIPGADAVMMAESKMVERANASARSARRGQRPWHVQTLLERSARPRELVHRARQRAYFVASEPSG
jgi:hypothetical protein